MNSDQKKEFQKNLRFIANMKVPELREQFQSITGKGDAQLDRLCNTVDLWEKNLATAQQSLVNYAKSRLEK